VLKRLAAWAWHVLKRLAAWPSGIRWLWRNHRATALFVCALAAAGLAIAFIWPFTDLIAAHDVGLIKGQQRAMQLQAAREATRTQLLTLGAGVLAAGALIFTAWNVTLYRSNLALYRRTNEITEEGQVTDRYTKAIEQLGSTTVDVRIGGIYALERVARDSPKDHPTVMEVLAAFIREHSRDPYTRPAPVADTPEPVTRPDIQAAVTVIGRRDAHDLRIDLRGVYLPHADLHEADFTGADFTGADLTRADLLEADLTRADLIDADLTSADLYGADLTGATLTGGHLTRAILTGADLTRADIRDADLTSARLDRANLTSATLTGTDLTTAQAAVGNPNPKPTNLRGADLTRADLTTAQAAVGNPDPKPANLAGADLTSAKFNGTHLAGAILTGADLTGADLTGADFTPADPTKSDPNPKPTDLTGADLTGVKFTPATLALADLTGAKWSEDVQPPGGWVYDHGQLRRG
jgi:uncharacterized protein YjbI with pentapeptide repeats